MPPSQLKRLKTLLRDQGVVGPQKSKKQKQQASKNGALRDSRIQKQTALQGIREHFNPFEIKAPSKTKHEFASNKTVGGRVGKGAVSRPGVTKGLGEEKVRRPSYSIILVAADILPKRRKTLLVEMNRRKKVGGIMDRRFGENDPTMTPEEKALERFVKEKQRGSKRRTTFDLEDEEEGVELTHFGQSLSYDKPARKDDFNEADLAMSDEDKTVEVLEERPSKRLRLSNADASEGGSVGEEDLVQPERPKTKKEVMEEVIAKSKLYKYERQQAKEDDDNLRSELDKGLPDLFALMRGTSRPPPVTQLPPNQNSGMNPDRLALLEGKERSQADKEYDERLRQMAMDQRAKPTVRTLTEEEKLLQEAQRLEELEEKRIRRMRGYPGDSESDAKENYQENDDDENLDPGEDDTFGLGSGLLGGERGQELGVEDEDEFVIEDDFLATGSESDPLDADTEVPGSESNEDDDQEFVQGLLSKEDAGREGLIFTRDLHGVSKAHGPAGNLAFTYKCPETHFDLLHVTGTIAVEDLPTVVQRIRALYHPKLASENKHKLGNFAMVLVEHVFYLANHTNHPPFVVLEALIRHIHSLAKTFSEDISRAFRLHLKAIHEERSTALNAGDLIILTAVSSVFPTSDHFHQVTTPAMLCMTRYLGQKVPISLSDLAKGTYLVTLCLQYQRLSKRYVPEVVNYVLNALWALAPVVPKRLAGTFPHHTLPDSLRLGNRSDTVSRPLAFWDVEPSIDPTNADNQGLKFALLNTQIDIIENMATIWAEKSAFSEIFEPIYTALSFLGSKISSKTFNDETREKIRNTAGKLQTQLHQSLLARKPLRLHNHRPLAIKTSIPKFEESYNPDKHYDPDRDRADMSKLKAEHKRERKGALRELRKDANFIARESLKEKKEKDSAYEKKYKRLVAEIQGEEGRESKNYERGKRMRKSKK